MQNTPYNRAKFAAAKENGDKFQIVTEKDINILDLSILFKLYKNEELIFDKEYDEKIIKLFQQNCLHV